MQDRKCYSDPKFLTDLTENSLPNSLTKNNGYIDCTQNCNTKASSLNNVICELRLQPFNYERSGSMSSQSQGSRKNSNVSATFPGNISSAIKRKKSNVSLLNFRNDYVYKLKSFRKAFAGSDAVCEVLLADFSCAYAKSSHAMLYQGRIYITSNWICFYSKIVSIESKIVLPLSGIVSITKEKTAKLIPNALRINTMSSKYFFTSFNTRDKAFNIINQMWQMHKRNEILGLNEQKEMIEDCYGEFDGEDVLIKILDEQNELQKHDDDDDHKNMMNGDCDFRKETIVTICNDRVEPENIIQFTKNLTGDASFIYKRRKSNNINEDESTSEDTGSYHGLKMEVDNRLTSQQLINNNNAVLKQPSQKYSRKHFDTFSNTNSGGIDHKASSTHHKTLSVGSAGVPHLHQKHNDQKHQHHFCEHHEHPGKCYLDTEIDVHIDKLYNFLFTNSHCFKKFMDDRKTFDIVVDKWGSLANSDKYRSLKYTLTLKGKIGPKVSPTEEKQYVRHVSKPGKFYLVDTHVYNSGFTYADCFHTENRYCLTYLSAYKTKIKVYSHLVFDKTVFFATKSLIESSSKSGISDYFTELEHHLKHESRASTKSIQYNTNSLDNTRIRNSSKRRLTRLDQMNMKQRSRSSSSSTYSIAPSVLPASFKSFRNESVNNSQIYNSDSLLITIYQKIFQPERAWLIIIVISLIVCLCLSFLYSQFRQLEEITNKQILLQNQLNNHHKDQALLKHTFTHKKEFVELDELQQWKRVIDNSVELLDEIKSVLFKVKSKIDNLPTNKFKASMTKTAITKHTIIELFNQISNNKKIAR